MDGCLNGWLDRWIVVTETNYNSQENFFIIKKTTMMTKWLPKNICILEEKGSVCEVVPK